MVIKKQKMINELNNCISDDESIKLKKYFDTELINFESTNSSNYLIADGLFINPKEDIFLRGILDRLLPIVGKNWKYVDYVNFIKYDEGGKFKKHSDFIDTSTQANIEDLKNGGQREHTFLIYLNDDFEGGETHFNIMNKTIKPEKNKLVWWKNTLGDGSQNIAVMHESKPILKGTKYLMAVWVRQQMIHTDKTLL